MHAKTRLHKVLCANLKAARLRAGLTQTQVADRMGRKQASYAQWETGLYPPGLDVLADLAEALDVEPHDLLNPRFAELAAA